MKRFFVTCTALALLFLAACSDNNEPGNNGVIPVNNGTPDTGQADTGSDTGDPEEDVGEQDAQTPQDTDDTEYTPGFLDGAWELKEQGEVVARLNFRHEEGATTATGTYAMVKYGSDTGDLGATRWQDEALTTSFTFTYEGGDYQLGISQAPKVDDNRLNATFTDPLAGDVVDGTLDRVE